MPDAATGRRLAVTWGVRVILGAEAARPDECPGDVRAAVQGSVPPGARS